PRNSRPGDENGAGWYSYPDRSTSCVASAHCNSGNWYSYIRTLYEYPANSGAFNRHHYPASVYSGRGRTRRGVAVMAQKIDALKLTKTLGRHTRLKIPYSWTIGGVPVPLEDNGYTVRVWVTNQTAETIAGPYPTIVAGNIAIYVMTVADLVAASESATDTVKIVAVAENKDMNLVSESREIVDGDWGGAENNEPIE